MKPLYTPEEFDSAKSRDLLSFECEFCHSPFFVEKHEIQKYQARINRGETPSKQLKFCSIKCRGNFMATGFLVKCGQCKKEVYKSLRDLKRNKKESFCSSSCAATYNNTHKTTGYRRSKLEIWIESQLRMKYPILFVDYNKTSAIGSELDLYVPSLRVAFELNGIFHYEEVYGTLFQIQKNDSQKYQKCIEQGISLCVIDTSHQKHFTPKSSQIFLDIICNILDQRIKMGYDTGNDPVPTPSQGVMLNLHTHRTIRK